MSAHRSNMQHTMSEVFFGLFLMNSTHFSRHVFCFVCNMDTETHKDLFDLSLITIVDMIWRIKPFNFSVLGWLLLRSCDREWYVILLYRVATVNVHILSLWKCMFHYNFPSSLVYYNFTKKVQKHCTSTSLQAVLLRLAWDNEWGVTGWLNLWSVGFNILWHQWLSLNPWEFVLIFSKSKLLC